MTSTQRVLNYHQRQRQTGRRLVTLYLHPDTIERLRKLAHGRMRGEVVERAVAELWRVHSNGDGVV
jgi:hypothetical protein